jgi:endonuclease/exonuclease/phosphatase family metal-dependent hydrolase
MKLISLNVEGYRHLSTTTELFRAEQADVICVQECGPWTIQILTELGYTTEFLPQCYKHDDEENVYEEGVLLASRLPVTFETFYYYEPTDELQLFVHGNARDTYKQGCILGTVIQEHTTYHILSNHFTWTPVGNRPNAAQVADMESFLHLTKDLPPHVACGDFNIPRNESHLYKRLAAQYTDTIPATYPSSLDKNLHRVGNDPEKEELFTKYMVDYLFTQPPYKAESVRLEFGISDHAAVIGDVYKA